MSRLRPVLHFVFLSKFHKKFVLVFQFCVHQHFKVCVCVCCIEIVYVLRFFGVAKKAARELHALQFCQYLVIKSKLCCASGVQCTLPTTIHCKLVSFAFGVLWRAFSLDILFICSNNDSRFAHTFHHVFNHENAAWQTLATLFINIHFFSCTLFRPTCLKLLWLHAIYTYITWKIILYILTKLIWRQPSLLNKVVYSCHRHHRRCCCCNNRRRVRNRQREKRMIPKKSARKINFPPKESKSLTRRKFATTENGKKN